MGLFPAENSWSNRHELRTPSATTMGRRAEAHLGCHPNASLKACSSTVSGYSNYGTAIEAIPSGVIYELSKNKLFKELPAFSRSSGTPGILECHDHDASQCLKIAAFDITCSQQLARFFKAQARTARKQLGGVAVTQVAHEIRFDRTFRHDFCGFGF